MIATETTRIAACALACLLTGSAWPATAFDGDALRSSLAKRLAVPALSGAQISALVVRERGGEVLFEADPDRALTPASNAKVLTAIAALAEFGPTHQFDTWLLADRAPDDQGEIGTLVVVGGGDPATNSEDWWLVANALRAEGVRRIDGDLVLDDGAFDAKRWHPAWGKTSARAYHAPVSALNANYGSFAVTVEAGASAGDPVAVRISPPVDHLVPQVRATTVARRPRRGLRIDRRPGADGREAVVVTGELRQGDGAVTFHRSVLDPTRYAGSVLRMQLASVGIEVTGATRVRTGPVPGVDADGVPQLPEAKERLHRHRGRPLAEIVRLFMKYSNNMIAESLVKAIGRSASGAPGSWSNGVPAARAALLRLGVPGEAFALTDGSGLAYQNKVTPRALVDALRRARRSFDFGPEFVASMPLAARDGTLEKRARDAAGQVRAKTGLLTRVTALSGVARLADGEPCLFSILVNGYRGSDQQAMDAVDGFVAALVSTGGATGPAAP